MNEEKFKPLACISAIFSENSIDVQDDNLDKLSKRDYSSLTPEELKELKLSTSRIKAFISNFLKRRINKKDKEDFVDELEKKYGPAKPGNPIYDQGQKMNRTEKELKSKGKELVE